MSNINEEFDPKKKTLKDYMIYLIDQTEEQKKELKEIAKKVDRLEKDLETRELLQKESEKRKKGFYVLIGVIGGAVGSVIQALRN